MIFVTVGTQLPFDRLVGQIDAWAAQSGEEVFAQVGPTEQKFDHLESVAFMDPGEADRLMREADVIIAHAGMGTILSALGYGTPLLVLPRRSDLGEHRNDHQVATARRLEERGLVTVAWNHEELDVHLQRLSNLKAGPEISGHASPELLAAVKDFLQG